MYMYNRMLVCAMILLALCGQHSHCEELPVSLTDSDTARGELTAWLEQFLQQHNQDMGELKTLAHAQQKQIEEIIEQKNQAQQNKIQAQQNQIEEIIEQNTAQHTTIQAQQNRIEEMSQQSQAQESQIQELKRMLIQSQSNIPEEAVTTANVSSFVSYAKTLDDVSSRKSARSDDSGPLEPVVAQLTSQVTLITAQVEALKTANEAMGSTYVRWGNAACPNSNELVYSGVMGGSYYDQPGGAANHLCLPHDPELYDTPVPADDGGGPAEVWGTEYDMREPQHQQNAVCAVCRSPRTSTFMLPAKMSCDAGWVQEFGGYLMAGPPNFASASEFICVDSQRGYMEGTGANDNGKLLYYAVTHCGSLSCPPYVNRQLVSCVVCSK